MPLIGVGGVDSADSAFEKIAAGASLVQLYTGMIYGGPGLPGEILCGLSAKLDQNGLKAITDAVGSGAGQWAVRSLPES